MYLRTSVQPHRHLSLLLLTGVVFPCQIGKPLVLSESRTSIAPLAFHQQHSECHIDAMEIVAAGHGARLR